MKKYFSLIALIFIVFMLVTCKKVPEIPGGSKIEFGETTVDSLGYFEAKIKTVVSSSGNGEIVQHGHCWSTEKEPTTAGNKTELGSALTSGSFSDELTGLNDSTTYYVRAYATLKQGVLYGNELIIKTLKTGKPFVTTVEITDITTNTAVGGGVNDDGGVQVTDRGVCWSTSNNPTTNDSHTTDGSGTGNFVSYITGLNESTTYFVRAYAINDRGIGYGEAKQFTTLEIGLPIIITNEASNITQTTATSGGNVTYDGGAQVTARGVCWSTSNNPTNNDSHTTDGSGTGNFVSYLNGLNESTTYYVRAYATNSVGTSYGNEVSFTTLAPPWQCGDQVTYEGQVYNTVEIGTQCWFKENLNVGVRIDGVNDPTNNWIIEKYCYDNDVAKCDQYGGLYNWDEMMQWAEIEGAQGICPSGWHVPTDDEWKILEGNTDTQFGVGNPEWNLDSWRGYDAGKRLKTTTGWIQNTGINTGGFSASPGGLRSDGSFGYLLYIGQWWSSSEYSGNTAWSRGLYDARDQVSRDNYIQYKTKGLSVRCLQD